MRPRRPPVPRVGENPRPPRYRLLTAAAALPQREPERLRQSYTGTCPACGTDAVFTQVETDAGTEYVVEDHPCAERGQSVSRHSSQRRSVPRS